MRELYFYVISVGSEIISFMKLIPHEAKTQELTDDMQYNHKINLGKGSPNKQTTPFHVHL